jgi:hypothetical protein
MPADSSDIRIRAAAFEDQQLTFEGSNDHIKTD